MQTETVDTIIIGGGLSGMYAASFTEYDLRSAHNHPEFRPPSGATSFWDGAVHFAGTETADYLGGYLEGALSSGERAASAALG